MSLYKAILHKKEHRRLYGGTYTFSCVNHNPRWCQCPWCVGNRLHSTKLRELKAKFNLKDDLYDYEGTIKVVCRKHIT